MTPQRTMDELIRELQALAQTGLRYAKDGYDEQRYGRIRQISFEMMAMHSEASVEAFADFFIPQEGYATPKVDLRGAVLDGDRVLLVQEKADGGWTMPGGWADVNEAPREGIEREVYEESGYIVRATRLIAIKDRERHDYMPKYPISLFKMFFLCELLGGQADPDMEIADVGFFSLDDLPPMTGSRTLVADIEMAFAARDAEHWQTYVD